MKGESLLIIEIRQTKSNLEQVFEILTNGNLSYFGRTSYSKESFTTQLFYPNLKLIYETQSSSLEESRNILSNKWISKEEITECCGIYDNHANLLGLINQDCKESTNNYYTITLGKDIVRVYCLLKNKTMQLLFVDVTGKQIAQGEKVVTDGINLHYYRIYLLDDYLRFQRIISLFVLYTVNIGYRVKEVSLKKNDLIPLYSSLEQKPMNYDPEWIKNNFFEYLLDNDVSDSKDYLGKNLKILFTLFGSAILSIALYMIL